MNTTFMEKGFGHGILQSTTALTSAMPRFLFRLLLPSVLVTFLTPFVILLFYSLPATDDYCKAALSYDAVRQPGVLAITWMYYMKWTPRTLTVLLQSLAMSRVSLITGYGWLLLAVIALNLAALWFFFRTVFRLTRKTSLLAAVTFYAAWVASITQPVEAIYWLTDATEYNLSLSALLVLVSLLYRPRHTTWYFVAVAALSLSIPAMHELAGTFLCIILLAGAAVALWRRVSAPQVYLSLGLAGLSQIIMLLAPGIAVRAAREHRHLWDIAHFPRWTAHAFYHGVNWVGYPAVLLAACCIWLLLQSERRRDAGSPPPRWFVVAGLCGMFFLLCEVALIETATGTWLPPYVITWFEFVFWLLFVCVVLGSSAEVSQTAFSPSTQVGVFVLLSVLLLGSSNFRAAVQDLRGSARSWWRMDSSRLQQRGTALVFRAPVRYPNLAMHQHLTADPGCWVNRCMATYLGAETVVVRDSTETCPGDPPGLGSPPR
jgi:hypothetical protein